MMLQCMSGDDRCLDDRELEQSMKVLTSLQVDLLLPVWVLPHWAHFTVHRSICVYLYFVCFCFILHMRCIIVSMVGWTWT